MFQDFGTTSEYGERMTSSVKTRRFQTGPSSSWASFRGGLHFAGPKFASDSSSKATKKRYHALFF